MANGFIRSSYFLACMQYDCMLLSEVVGRTCFELVMTFLSPSKSHSRWEVMHDLPIYVALFVRKALSVHYSAIDCASFPSMHTFRTLRSQETSQVPRWKARPRSVSQGSSFSQLQLSHALQPCACLQRGILRPPHPAHRHLPHPHRHESFH